MASKFGNKTSRANIFRLQTDSYKCSPTLLPAFGAAQTLWKNLEGSTNEATATELCYSGLMVDYSADTGNGFPKVKPVTIFCPP